MKKKFIIIAIVVLITLIPSLVLAEAPDFEALSFEELSSWKAKIDEEYYSRQEAESRVLFPGFYTVGIDFPAGPYYYCVSEPDDNNGLLQFEIYPSKDNYMQEITQGAINGHLYYGTSSKYMFNDGNYLHVKNTKMTISLNPIPDSYFVQYEPPTNTLVPIGTYIVGIELPEGDYYVFPSSLVSSYFAVYRDEESSRNSYSSPIDDFRVVVTKSGEGRAISLKEGQAIVVKDADVFMKKRKVDALHFD